MMHHWLLPEYIEDVLPTEAAHIESLRHDILNLLRVHGYQFVIPPMLEYLESLITGAGRDLGDVTFKVVDQLSGKLMGVRADTTPQAARIDAHLLNSQSVTRLCYAGSVLKTQPDGLAQTRELLQIGAELFGFAGVEGDIEIQRLMVHALQRAGIIGLHIDLSHVGIFTDLVTQSSLATEWHQPLYQALQAKDMTEVMALTRTLDSQYQQAFCRLTTLYGAPSILDEAEKILPPSDSLMHAIQELRMAAAALDKYDVDVCIDLSELRGYHYHSGIVFAAYAQGYTGPLALGGRYDHVGEVFGRARPATGFSLDLKGLLTALPASEPTRGIFAPRIVSDSLESKIQALRNTGAIVVQPLIPIEKIVISDQGVMMVEGIPCDRILVAVENDWSLEPISDKSVLS